MLVLLLWFKLSKARVTCSSYSKLQAVKTHSLTYRTTNILLTQSNLTDPGKSTVLCLLERFYDVAEGTVLIDGMDIRAIDPRWLHRNLVIVPQEPVLFSGSIFSNIA